MAGIGIKLNKIYRKKSLAAKISGFIYSAVITVAPMFVVIGAILLGQWLLGFSHVRYVERELFSNTVLYVFIFSLLAVAPFNSFLSKYISDVIFEEKFDDIMPCFFLGLAMTIVFGSIFGVPFCIHEYLAGKVALYYVFTSYSAFIALILVFYTMVFLSITKSYGKISLFFILGMCLTIVLADIFYFLLHFDATYSLLLALTLGFLLTAILELTLLRAFFRRSSRAYREVFRSMKKYWKMILINFLYTMGLYIHIFVFWTSEFRNVLVDTFVTAQPYDMASCLAMFTNISATIIFTTNVELHFRDRYRRYYEAVLGGRGHDIDNAKGRMFQKLSTEVFSLVRVQFIITVCIFLVCMIVLPLCGFAGVTMRIYPGLCVGYFILFILYSIILFLYYFNDQTGALIVTAALFLVTFFGSILSKNLTETWYGLGLILGALTGFVLGYFRLRYIEKTIDFRTFCFGQGDLIKRSSGKKPSSKVFSRESVKK